MPNPGPPWYSPGMDELSNFYAYVAETRNALKTALKEYLDDEANNSASFYGETNYIFSTLASYALNGKMLRGVLSRLGYDLFSPAMASPAMARDQVSLALALELFQAGLLVHDDIMDEDEIRRGQPTIHKQMEARERTRSKEGTPEDAYRKTGTSLAICAGDICFFEAWGLLGRLKTPSPALLSLFSRELANVCLAQMADVRLGSHSFMPDKEEILEVYAYKTARYTITLPLCSGAILAGREDALPLLEDVGKHLGILFQLQDDLLGIFGDEASLGKPIGSDIREGKKTPLVIALYPRLSGQDKALFDGIFGKEEISRGDIEYVRGLMRSHGIDSMVREEAEAYAEGARKGIARLETEGKIENLEALALLRDFTLYSLGRTR